MNRGWIWLGALTIGVIGLLIFLNAQFPNAMAEEGSAMRIVYLVALLAYLASAIFLGNQMSVSYVIKTGLAWVAIFALLVIGYVYKDDLLSMSDRVSAEVVPMNPSQEGAGMVTLHRQSDGHFGVVARVNDKRVGFVVDTGASDVVLTYRDAERAGLEPWNLKFNRPYNTANGVTYGAQINIQSIQIGDIKLHNVKGSVMKEGLDISLLGMTFLDRLDSYSVSGNKLTLIR